MTKPNKILRRYWREQKREQRLNKRAVDKTMDDLIARLETTNRLITRPVLKYP
jgi:hypothetical protein